ncbi:MAG: hypothetical protein V3575_01395 [Candidatus Absconditabacteria bacterium]
MIREKKLLVQKIRENLDLLYELDKEAFIEAMNEISAKISKVRSMSGEAKSIIFEKGLLSISEKEQLEELTVNLLELLKEKFGLGREYIINELALFKIYGNHIVPVYFLTLIPDRFTLFENNSQKLALEIERNAKSLGQSLTDLQEGKVYFGTEKKFDDFDMIFRKGKTLVGLNNYYYSLSELEAHYNIDMEKMLKFVNVVLQDKVIFN